MLPPQDDFINRSHVRSVELAQSGDSEAFTILVHYIEDEIYRYLVGLVGNDEEARDLTQDAIIKIWQKLPTLQNPSKFKPWSYTVARHLAYDHLRQRQRRKKRVSLQSWEELKSNDEAAFASDFQNLLEEEELLKLALTELPQRYRNCLLLQVIGEFSQQEIADQMGISKGSVCVYVSKARIQLREIFQRLGVKLSRQEKGGHSNE